MPLGRGGKSVVYATKGKKKDKKTVQKGTKKSKKK